LGDAGSCDVIPTNYMNSSLYFASNAFPSGINQLTHKHNGDECTYERVKKRPVCVNYMSRKKVKLVMYQNQMQNKKTMDGLNELQ
jgi:hypothetical protein